MIRSIPFCNCLTLIYFMIAVYHIKGSATKLVVKWALHTIISVRLFHSDFIRQDIITFVRVRVKKWRNHCLR